MNADMVASIEARSIPVPEAGCWLWTGYWKELGYGTAQLRGRNTGAHRVSWEAFNGPIPDGLFVCHKCDTPACVNPDHLFLGTATDNARDMARKGRAIGQSFTHCTAGHEYTPENTKFDRGRVCRRCYNLSCRRRERRRLAARLGRTFEWFTTIPPSQGTCPSHKLKARQHAVVVPPDGLPASQGDWRVACGLRAQIGWHSDPAVTSRCARCEEIIAAAAQGPKAAPLPEIPAFRKRTRKF